MYYQKFIVEEIEIEFHNSWTGEETVTVNKQIVSKKSSVWGTHHVFSVIENSKSINFVLTTKVNSNMQIFLDLKKDGELIKENIPVMMGGSPKNPENKHKTKGLHKLKNFDLDEALVEFQKALIIDAKDPEIYIQMACVYSIQEDTVNGFSCLKKAVENKLQNIDIILTHDMLAFLRIQEGFEDFKNSNYTKLK